MLRRFLGVGVAFVCVAGLALAADQDQKDQARPRRGNFAVGKVQSLKLNNDGTGTLTVMARRGRNAEPMEMTFKITKETKFMKGGGRGQEGTAVESSKVADTFKKDAQVAVRYTGEGKNLTAVVVRTGLQRRPRQNQ